ncbi:MAG: hypothetical protein WCR69_04700 [Sulfuricurvum sp.]
MKSLLFLLLSIALFGSNIKEELADLYNKKEYEQVCKKGFNAFNQNLKDEEFLSLYAYGCLYADYIDRLAVPIASLKFTKEGRANASYFSIVLMQKKLLFYSINDGYDISGLNMPTTEYILSKVFDLYTKEPYTKGKESFSLVDNIDDSITYKLYLEHDPKLNKMIIEKYKDSTFVERHIYW